MSLYHSSVFNWGAPVKSLWEETSSPFVGNSPLKDGDVCDVAIIGGGYTGLSTALHLTSEGHLDVRVLEAGHIAWGASGRNGGFCNLHPSSKDFVGLARTYGMAETKRYVASQVEAVDLVRSLINQENIDAAVQGAGVFEVAHNKRQFSHLRDEADFLEKEFDIPTRVLPADEFSDEVYSSTEQFGGLWTGIGFGLHPLRFARGLADVAERVGAKLHAHCRVVEWRKEGQHHVLTTPSGKLRAKQVVVATNGFTPDGLHPSFSGRLLPVMSNIFTTRQLTDDELAAQNWRTQTPCSNTRNLLFYYRLLPDNRFLFGARGDLTGHPDASQRMYQWMRKRFGQVFPAWQAVETTHFWRGLVCMARDLTPSIGALEDDPTVFYGLAYHGNGVAAAPWAGRELAKLVLRKTVVADLPSPLRGPIPKIPFPALRRWYLQAALAYYRVKDL
jgi:glycine/D-amino acid oxidase-like deaminating enzyme